MEREAEWASQRAQERWGVKGYFEDYVVVSDDLKAPKDSTLIGSDILGNKLNQKYKSGPRTQHSMEYRKQTSEHEYSSILHLQLIMVLHARTIWETKDTSQNCTCNTVPRRHLLKPSAYASSKTVTYSGD
eukprot:gene1113-3946_t